MKIAKSCPTFSVNFLQGKGIIGSMDDSRTPYIIKSGTQEGGEIIEGG